MTFKCPPRLHVQSMIFATDNVGMGIPLDPEIAATTSVDNQFGTGDSPVGLSGCYRDCNGAVYAQVGMTGLIMNAGHKAGVMMTALRSEDGMEEYCRAHPDSGDLL
ncbi:hypothetical protein LZ30DRAFT_805548 [Colletotrichum cereale]|nr:hypothetical protein LZ30DRAFT_805548 [Colletotrichum cereale]